MLNSEKYNGKIFVGKVVLTLLIPNLSMKVCRNRHKIFANNTFDLQSKNYFRSHYPNISGKGNGGRFIL